MRQRLLALCAVAAGSYTLIGCAVSPEEDPVYIRMNDLDARVQRIERVVTNQSLIEMAQRIDALQAELRAMRGEVEVLQNQSEGGKTQTRTLYGDLEKRIAALETLGGVAGSNAGSATPVVPPPGGVSAGGGEQASYDAAFNALKGSDYQRAIAGFKNFVSTYPASPLASNAQYWLGEAYYVNREYPNAIGAFQRVIADWPDSRKAPDALVKIGFTQAALGKTAEARDTLENVQKRYPGTEAATLAAERLKRMSNGK
ncbi:MAG: tol-pal system protein YbgF [Pseudomonadota bacterium]